MKQASGFMRHHPDSTPVNPGVLNLDLQAGLYTVIVFRMLDPG